MPLCLHLIALVVAGALWAGCSRSNTPARSGDASQTVEHAKEDLGRMPDAVERRTAAHARYATGVILDLNEDPEGAVEEYNKAALADVRDEELVLEVTRRLLQLRQQEKALEMLKKATDSPKASGLLYARLGMVYSMLGKKDEALEANRIAIRRAPQNLAGYQNLVHVYLQARQ